MLHFSAEGAGHSMEIMDGNKVDICQAPRKKTEQVRRVASHDELVILACEHRGEERMEPHDMARTPMMMSEPMLGPMYKHVYVLRNEANHESSINYINTSCSRDPWSVSFGSHPHLCFLADTIL